MHNHLCSKQCHSVFPGLTPKPLYLHLDVAVYYLFLQLYALFPCNFFTFLRGRYGPMGERGDFRQYIAVSLNRIAALNEIVLYMCECIEAIGKQVFV